MSVVNIRLMGRDEQGLRAAIDELHYLTSGIVDRPPSAPRLTVEIHEPREGRRGEWLAYGAVVITGGSTT